MSELPFTDKKLLISAHEIHDAVICAKNYIIDALIEAGAPIKLTRKNNFDISKYRDDEIEVVGTLVEYGPQPNGDYIVFGWNKKEDPARMKPD